MPRLCQLALVSRILDASQETVWPERKQCSTKADFRDSLCSTALHVTAALVANGYPKRFVIDVGKPKWLAQQLSTTAPDAAKGFCILPYIKGTSEPIKQILSNYDLKVAQKPHQTIGNLFPKPKDPVSKDQTRGAIYSIPCKDCDIELYRGNQTQIFYSP